LVKIAQALKSHRAIPRHFWEHCVSIILLSKPLYRTYTFQSKGIEDRQHDLQWRSSPDGDRFVCPSHRGGWPVMRDVESNLAQPVRRALKKFGADIRVARLKRSLTIKTMADSIGVHRSTYTKVENGDPMVGLGIYAAALFALGLGTPLDDVVDPRRDEMGLLLDLERLPKRARTKEGVGHVFVPVRLENRRTMAAGQSVLRIGVLGVMSGPSAKWGLVNKYCAQATAEMYNERGGVEIAGQKFRIEIVHFDDKLDPELAGSGARRLMAKEGIRYVIGPNVEQTISSVAPIAEKQDAMLFTYSYTRSMYAPPHENAVLGQIPGFQAGPVIYKYLRDNRGVKRLSVLSPATREGLRQSHEIVSAAERLGLRIISSDCTYRSGSSDFFQDVAKAIEGEPDLVVLPNLAPEDAPLLIKTARKLAYRGFLATEAAQDINILNRGAGSVADDFVVLGGASVPGTRSTYMEEFARRYMRIAGEWNDEAGTKVYALEIILATLRKAGKAAIEDVNRFKANIPHFTMTNPFVKHESTLRYVGADYFQQKRQIGVPMVVNTVKNGRFVPLFVEAAH
jgi:branched-chain amino acid transport system substrate-binding protein